MKLTESLKHVQFYCTSFLGFCVSFISRVWISVLSLPVIFWNICLSYTSCFQLLLTFQLFISVQSLTLVSVAQLLYFPFSRLCCLHKNNPCRHALLLLVFCCTLCAFVFLLLLTGCEWSFAYFVGSCFWSSICQICLPEWLTFHVWPQPGNNDLIFPSILCCIFGCEPFVSHS